MVFKVPDNADPGTVVVDRKTRKALARFKDGQFETEDEKLIARLKPHYEAVEIKRKARSGKAG